MNLPTKIRYFADNGKLLCDKVSLCTNKAVPIRVPLYSFYPHNMRERVVLFSYLLIFLLLLISLLLFNIK